MSPSSRRASDERTRRLTFLDVAATVLERRGVPLTPVEIWNLAGEWGLAKQLESEGKTPQKSMYARLLVDVRENPQSRFAEASVRPIRYGLRGRVPKDWVAPEDVGPLLPSAAEGGERALHPPLAAFAYHRLGAFVKTIHHETSARRHYSKWLHPDLAGIAYPISDDSRLAINVAALVGTRPAKLLSFEMKRSLDFGNLREAFFQAVSNSSWSHLGYLVAESISVDEDFVEELTRLSSTHGIGVIRLDAKVPLDSEVQAQARLRTDLDWVTMSKLSSMNPDFRQFLESVRVDIESGVVHPSDYDTVPGIGQR